MDFNYERTVDPVGFCEHCWPDIHLYDKQIEILYSVRDNDETFVVAGNELGKDFIAGFLVLWFFISRRPAKVITTSVKGDQLNDVLWAEIRRFIDTSKYKLPIAYNHLHIRQIRNDGSYEPRSSLTGQVVQKGESLLGRHIERPPNGDPCTLAVFDEASGIDNQAYESSDTWAHRKLIIGNPYHCENFFREGVKAGDLQAEGNGRLYRKVIRVKATDSPNIRYAMAEERKGRKLSGKVLIPGVADYPTYLKRRKLWSNVRQCIGLDAEFYLGADTLLYPPEWLNRAETLAEGYGNRQRKAEAMGVDTAEGGDKSCWVVVDKLGVIDLLSMKTPDTSIIPGRTLALMRQYNVPAERVCFDQGGGGKEHADRLRSEGHKVRMIAFGGAASLQDITRRMRTVSERMEERETRYIYKNRRAEMYGILRVLLNPDNKGEFGISTKYSELRRQLSPIPLDYGNEGRLQLPPKQKRSPNSTEQTMTELLGCSPDEADALVLAVFGMLSQPARSRIRSMV